jgi:acetolactate synthase I/II/III large subunit
MLPMNWRKKIKNNTSKVMRLADIVVNFLVQKHVDTIFMVVGGQAMYLNDAVYKNKKIKPIHTHHEQAAAMAAEAYARIKHYPGVAMVTAGPGSINALNGVLGGWVDSSPMLIISGQSNSSVSKYMESNPIRQHGTQGVNTKAYVQAATKYFKTVDDPEKILYYMEEAYYNATTGRAGPVWINIPLDLQGKELNQKKLLHFKTPKINNNQKNNDASAQKIINLLVKAKRPLLIVGQGVRIAKAEKELEKFIDKVKPLIMTTRLGIDLIDSRNPLFCGRPGQYGDRYANINVQNADLILILGARMDAGITGYDQANWGKNAQIIDVDIDKEELKKPGIRIDLKINGNIASFLPILNKKLKAITLPDYSSWIKFSNKLKTKYPTVLPEYKTERLVNSYYLTKRISDFARNDDMILVDTSSPFHVVSQAWEIKLGQRFLTTGGISTMGYWPAGIGVALSYPQKRTIVITGDGCLQMNLQELATIKQNNIPIKLFIFNNNGYLLIRHTQKTHFDGHFIGESPETGLFIPDSVKLAKVYGIKSLRINNTKELDRKIREVLNYPGPIVCDVMTPKWQPIIPRIASEKNNEGRMISRPYEDLFPFLDRDELKSNLIGNTDEK